MVYKIKTMLKCLFIFVDQNETKRNVITLFRLVSCVSLMVSLQGLSGLPGFRNKTRPIATQLGKTTHGNSVKLRENRGHGNTLRRRRRRHFLKLHSRHYLEKTTTNKVKSDRERDRWPASSDFSLQAIQVTDTHFICTF